MRCVAMNFSGVNHRAFTPDRDCLLQAATSSSGNVLISDNPSSASADVATPATNDNRTDVLFYSGSAGSAQSQLGFPLQIPLTKDRAIYVAASTSSCVFLYLEDVVSAE